jgi:hypothetical protein
MGCAARRSGLALGGRDSHPSKKQTAIATTLVVTMRTPRAGDRESHARRVVMRSPTG